MDLLNIELSSVKLANTNILREPPRKEEDQQENYKELFDYNTLFSDIFFTDKSIELVGPPLLNLQDVLLKENIYVDGVDVTDKLIIQSIHRKCRIILPNHQSAKEISIQFGNETFNKKIQPYEGEFFKDANVLVTQQKDNPLEWIGYWIAHHIKHHKIDSVVIYDNNSSIYSLNDLKNLLSSIKGLKKACVINWDIPYGVTGGDKAIWDSDFGQYQSWEHAFKRLVNKANSVIIGDVDELIIHKNGIAIPDLLAQINEPVVAYKRRQIIEVASTAFAHLPRMHNHTHLYEKERILYAPKYAFNPKKISPDAHLLVHKVEGDKTYISEDILGRHFGCLRIHWRVGDFEPIAMRNRGSYKTTLIEDEQLLKSFDDIDISWLENI